MKYLQFTLQDLGQLFHLIVKYFVFYWRGSEYATAKYAALPLGLFWAGGNWESTDARRDLCLPLTCLKAGREIPLELVAPVLPGKEDHLSPKRCESTLRQVCINRPYEITVIFHESHYLFPSHFPIINCHSKPRSLSFVQMVYQFQSLTTFFELHFFSVNSHECKY